MASIAETVLTLRFFGDDLDPDEVSALLGAEPSHGARKGDPRGQRDGTEIAAKTGTWQLSPPDRTPGNLTGQLHELFSQLNPDVSVWKVLARKYRADVFCGLFMELGNEGEELSPAALAGLGDRGLTLGFDIYDPTRDERDLSRHPQSQGGDHLVAYVDFDRRHSDVLSLRFVLRGDLAAVRLPPAAEFERTDELWRTTCFEVFVRSGSDAYFEFNFSPSTRWAAYHFDAYRADIVQAAVSEPGIFVDIRPRRLELVAELPLHELPALAGRPWSVGVSAVIEDVNGAVSYWALAHPPGKPDFHHPDSFALELAPTDPA